MAAGRRVAPNITISTLQQAHESSVGRERAKQAENVVRVYAGPLREIARIVSNG
jgi:hypothetical protein